MTDVLIIGGGVVGVTTAAALARRGMKVTILERRRTIGSGVTARNGAQLSYCYTDAIASPSMLRDLPRLLVGVDPAFRIRLGRDLHFVEWTLRFLANCTKARFADNTRAVLRLALKSRDALCALQSHYPDLEFRHATSGKIHLYYSAAKLESAAKISQIKRDMGCDQRTLTRDELFSIEPALCGNTRGIVGAIYSPADEAGDAYEFTNSLASIAAREHQITILTGTVADQFIVEGRRVRAINTYPHGPLEADLFVLAAGAESAALARTANVKVPIYPMKGYSVTLPATESSPKISITDSSARIVFCRLQDRMRIAGIGELGYFDDAVERCRIDYLLSGARACLPGAADWTAEPNGWSGLRPMTPDSRPIIGRTFIDNLLLNCGHGMLGWTLACGSAALLATLVEKPASQEAQLASDFSPARFGG